MARSKSKLRRKRHRWALRHQRSREHRKAAKTVAKDRTVGE